MRTETKRQIRESVLYDMAPAQAGQLSLEDVARVFRGRADFGEVEESLDELVKEGLAEKTEFSGHSYYVFQNIANEATVENERRLRQIERDLEKAREDEKEIERILKEEGSALSRLRPIWLSGWEKSKLGSEEISKLQRYISASISRHSEGHGREQTLVRARILALEEERQRRLKWKEETFITVPASR